MFLNILQSLRPRQWSKNLLIFAGLIFSQNLSHLGYLLKSTAAFGIFCLLSGGMYLINDLVDLERDRAHPLKCDRPLASGKLKVSTALAIAITLTGVSISLAFLLNRTFGLVALGYFLLITAYSLVLKNLVILDVLAIALGFVLRAAAGAVVIGVQISSWLLVCTMFLSLFLVLCKRRHELVLLGENSASHRKILFEYTPHLLDQMVAVVTASMVTAYTLYTTAEETISKFNTRNLILTVLFVIYGIFRYLYLVHQKSLGGNPEIVITKDLPMVINLILYLTVVLIIIYT